MITDERSAGFFAVGLARASRRTVAVVCTSGTAVANLGPAVAEASFAEVPLLLLTADRPAELRDCGAPQTIRQAGLFAPHVRWSVDAAVPDDGAELEPYFRTLACRAVATAVAAPMGPVHLNLPFREPLFDPAAAHAGSRAESGRPDGRPWTTVAPATLGVGHATVTELTRIVRSSPRGLLVCGPATGTQPSYVAAADLGRRLGWPVLADPLSGVRHGMHDRRAVIDAYDVLLRSPAFRDRHRADVIVRFGAVPTSKALQQYLSTTCATHHVLVAAPGTWPDPLASRQRASSTRTPPTYAPASANRSPPSHRPQAGRGYRPGGMPPTPSAAQLMRTSAHTPACANCTCPQTSCACSRTMRCWSSATACRSVTSIPSSAERTRRATSSPTVAPTASTACCRRPSAWPPAADDRRRCWSAT